MHHELFEEMQQLLSMDPSETTEEQEDRFGTRLVSVARRHILASSHAGPCLSAGAEMIPLI